jgi:hypothetical protein
MVAKRGVSGIEYSVLGVNLTCHTYQLYFLRLYFEDEPMLISGDHCSDKDFDS